MAEFTKGKSKNFRTRKSSSDEDDDSEDDTVVTKLEDIRVIQKLRERPKGVNAVGLALGKKITKTEEIEGTVEDPFKMKTGGFVDLKTIKINRAALTEEENEAIGTAFAAETNRRDEDAEMLRYVEEQLAKTKGRTTAKDDNKKNTKNENALYELPENLKAAASTTKKTEDMLSNQMLSGIPEVDLGIEEKIKNIETTEEAKQRLIEERLKKKDDISVFVPTNMAVNFVQHNRFNIEDTAPILKSKADSKLSEQKGKRGKPKEERPLTVQPDEKATDDFHFEKFRKQMRRF
ncbi:hypothetical protein CHS0354_032003 [Potamilus streckersoni]|uniref:Telomere length and silencing protein 1 homolog n=1 Tax=Potamilus streckersoni TaxID=2493646 RepID=A0AAE0WG70_9BIVA|nr:hypothetical protein CHS0354_032003 [Potamilus streckersoni]